MKDKIITLASNMDFYIIEELDYNNKKYILGSKCDLKKETIDTEELDLFEVDYINNDLVINNVEDEVAKEVTNIMLEKIQKNYL